MKLRTRDFHSLTNYEIEQYLSQNDVIFIPVGNAECHGPYPVDCEYVMAEAWAKLFAEKFDGLYLPGLVELPAGATISMRGTIQMGEFDAMHYMYALSRSLLKQGFRRQIYIPSHRQSELFMHPVLHQLIEDVKVPFLMLSPMYLFAQNGLMKDFGFPRGKTGEKPTWGGKILSDDEGMGAHARMLGAYQIVGRLDAVPSKEELDIPEDQFAKPDWIMNHWFPDHDILNECSNVHGPAPFLYKDNNDHAGLPMVDTIEEKKREADIGEKWMRSLIDQIDFDRHLNALKGLDDFIQNEVLPIHKDNLPDDRWSY